MKRMSGFTLIELLVVVAIIALLVAIILPSLGAAKKRARTVTCLTNVRALASSTHVYIQDWGKVFLGGGHGAPLDAWDNQLLRNEVSQLSYNSNNGRKDARDKLRWCSETAVTATARVGGTDQQWSCAQVNGHWTTGSYAFNGWLYEPGDRWAGSLAGGVWNPSKCFTFPFTSSESDVPAFVDGTWHDMWVTETDPVYPGTNSAWVAGISPPSGTQFQAGPGGGGVVPDAGNFTSGLPTAYVDRHEKAVNVAFVDGHGETVKLVDLPKLRWYAQ